MEHRQPGSAEFPRVLTDVVADVSDLVRKEFRLARAEVTAKLSTKLKAGIWMAVAAGFGLIGMLLVVQAAVFAIAARGFALHWAALMVAAGLFAIGGIAYAVGHAGAHEDITPNRTIHQIKQDIATARSS